MNTFTTGLRVRFLRVTMAPLRRVRARLVRRKELGDSAVKRSRIRTVHPVRGIWNRDTRSVLNAGLDHVQNCTESLWAFVSTDEQNGHCQLAQVCAANGATMLVLSTF